MKRKLVANAAGEVLIQAGTGNESWRENMIAAEDWERSHKTEWTRVDQKLRGIAARRAALDVEEAHLLRYAEELKLWRAYGFGSLLEYMERAMGYAPHTATERMRVARARAELPLLEEALERGDLAHSAVRELSRVAVPESEAAWLEAAQGKCLREVEAMVSGHRPGDLPEDPTEPRLHRRTITLELSPETYDIWRRLHALAAEEHGQRLSDDELIQTLFRRAYSDGRPSAAATAGILRTVATATASTPDVASTLTTAIAPEAASSLAPAAEPASTLTTAIAPEAASSLAPAAEPASTLAPAAGATNDAAAVASTVAIAATVAIVSNAAVAAADTVPGDSRGAIGPGIAVAISIAGASDISGAAGAYGSFSSPAYKIALKQCPDCSRVWQYSGGRDIEVDPAVLECAECDAVHLGSLDATSPERATTTVTLRKREQVLARDGYCCTVPGCRRNVGLDLHHIDYQNHGGGHELSNLTAICDLHHRAVHFGKLVIGGIAPDRLTFDFRKPRERRNVTDDDAPLRTIATHPAAATTHRAADTESPAEPTYLDRGFTTRPTGKA
jgi:hypothetical protein